MKKKHLSILSVVFAFGAALFWGWSAFVNVPILKSGYGTLVSVTKDGSVLGDEAPFYAALGKISLLNALAAGCAFVSAAAQAITLVLGEQSRSSSADHETTHEA